MNSTALASRRFPICLWRLARHAPKCRREMALTAEAHPITDFDKRQFSLDKQLLGTFHAAVEQILVGCQAGSVFEGPDEMVGAQVDLCGDLCQRQIPGQVVFNVIFGAPELMGREPAI